MMMIMAGKIHPYLITVLFSFIFFCNPFILRVNGYDNPAPHDHIDDVAINCGYHGNSTALDGRQWFGDEGGTRSAIFRLQPRGESTSSTADHRSLSADPIPYMSARVSSTQFYYTFQVNPGQKFIRLHFHPSAYRGFEKSRDFFTVKAGPFTLLKNFSASITAEALGVKYLVKEYCLNVGKEKYLNLTFTPSHDTKQSNIYAFVNGIEIISMPVGLYYTPDGDLGVPIVGQNNRYLIDNNTALEMVQRLNIGGSSISPVEDFGLYRRWNEDTNYLLEPKLEPVNQLVHAIKYTGKTIFTAPLKIYHRSWRTVNNGMEEKLHNFTWKIQVDLGFGYLIRLHLCEFGSEVTGSFNILINDQIAESKADVIRLSGGTGVPIHMDYVVFLKGDNKEGKFELFIALQSFDESIVRLLHGLEIFKLSSFENNLASPNPVYPKQVPTSSNRKIKNLLLAFGKSNAIGTGMTILIMLLSIVVFKLRQILEETGHEEEDTRSASSRWSFRRFTRDEIISATQNFSEAFLIGRGGFGNVYKGFIRGGSQVLAVKRLKSNSNQGAHEFWTEIETLSKVRHFHLVSLVGYCNEYQEMILVYEYMPCGTLADKLYKNGRNGKDSTPLTWEQRLRITIGAARGLDYLHSGIEHGVIHRDVKASNILLDENLVAKVSDFGLSKLGNISESQGDLSTNVKGTFGYLDPHYIMTHKPTRKTDVYAFGVVMLVVLCGRPAIDRRIPGEIQILLSIFQEGGIDGIIDPSLQGNLSSESLREFLTCIEGCLNHQPKERPTMAQVVAILENALERQQTIPSSISDKASSVGQPDKVEDMQPSQFNQNMVSPIFAESVTVISPLEEEGIEAQANQTVEIKTTGVVFRLREKDISIQKPLWVWPWEALRKRRKPMDPFSMDPFSMAIADIQAATDNFNDDHLIVDDEFVMVYKGFIKTQNAAIYRFKTEIYKEKVLQFRSEVEKLSQIGHENLAVLIGYCYHLNEVFIVYQYMANGILHNSLYDDRCVPLTWHQRLQICLGVAQGLNYLHNGTDKRIIHYDLNPKNILLDGNLTPYISNSGLCTVSPIIGHLATASSTKHPLFWVHLPPEVILSSSTTTEKTDIYSFGLVLLEVLCSRRPIKFGIVGYDPERYLKKRVEKSIKSRTLHEIIDSKLKGQITERCLAEFLKIALSCLAELQRYRPSMSHVVERLQVAIHLQENAESANEGMNKDFKFEHIYQELSNSEGDQSDSFPGISNSIISLTEMSNSTEVFSQMQKFQLLVSDDY